MGLTLGDRLAEVSPVCRVVYHLVLSGDMRSPVHLQYVPDLDCPNAIAPAILGQRAPAALDPAGGMELQRRSCCIRPAFWDKGHSAMAVLRTPALRRVFTAFFIFGTAEWATWIAILVWAFDRGGASAAGLISVAQMIRRRWRRLLPPQCSNGCVETEHLRLATGCRPLPGWPSASCWSRRPCLAVYVAAAIATTSIVLTRPMHHAIIPEIAETPEEITVGHSASSTIEGLSTLVGPIVAGVLLGCTGRVLSSSSPAPALWLRCS